MTTVCALVLTRNRRAFLAECLRALDAQTRAPDRIVVLDNASEDGTGELLAEEGWRERSDVIYVRSPRNLGSAGGYAEGLRLALEQETDWIWLMDDDAEPRPDALERLFAAAPARDPATASLAPAVLRPDGTVDVLHRCLLRRFVVPVPRSAYEPGHYATIDCASWVGHLVRASAARAAGAPRAEFFITFDDAEWSLRLRRSGRIALVPEAGVVHKLRMGGRQATARSRALNRLIRVDYDTTPWESFWRSLYGLRNFMWIKHRYGSVGPLAFAVLTAVYVAKSLLYDAEPLRRIPWIVRFAWKGRVGDFSGPTPEEWAENARRRTATFR